MEDKSLPRMANMIAACGVDIAPRFRSAVRPRQHCSRLVAVFAGPCSIAFGASLRRRRQMLQSHSMILYEDSRIHPMARTKVCICSWRLGVTCPSTNLAEMPSKSLELLSLRWWVYTLWKPSPPGSSACVSRRRRRKAAYSKPGDRVEPEPTSRSVSTPIRRRAALHKSQE